MCGLAGFARHPKSPSLKKTLGVHRDLSIAAQDRGRHATGFAVLSAKDSFIKKWAMDMDAILKNGLYNREIHKKVPASVRYMIGHTRHATLPNKDDDNAAHPFMFDQTVGCHNGSIVNWREIQRDHEQDGWLTDSQAALWALDHEDNPSDALKMLDGWWALAWVKSGRLFLSRTDERPLAVAYSKKMKTLWWASDKSKLSATMKKHGIKATVWELSPSTIYEFDPARFNSKAHPKKIKVKLDRPSADMATPRDVPIMQGGLWDKPRAPYRFKSARTWVDDVNEKNRGQRPQTFASLSREVGKRLGAMESRVEKLEEEVEFLHEYIADHCPTVEDGASCRECGRGADAGVLLGLPDGRFIHSGCVLK